MATYTNEEIKVNKDYACKKHIKAHKSVLVQTVIQTCI